MTLSIFENKSLVPDEKSVANVLGSIYKIWEEIKKFVFEEYPDAAEEWKFTGKNYGWGYRLKDKRRVIIYMTPQKGYFFSAFMFGDKAYKEILKSKISEEIKGSLKKARVYMEGRGIRIEVKDIENVDNIKQLVEIKLRN